MNRAMRVGELVDQVLAGPVTLEYWLGEVRELWDEVRGLRWAGVREEWGDVCALGLAHLTARGWPVRRVPLLPGLGLGSARKFQRRLGTWRRIFGHHGAEFRREYLIDGGNFAKFSKVQAALSRAGVVTVDVDWLVAEGIVVLES